MNNFLLILAFLFTFSFAASTKVDWDKEAVLNYQKEFTDPSFSTLWGGLRRALHWPNHKGKMVEVLPKGFKEKVPVYIYSTPIKKDLFVFYPGVFGRPDGRIGPHAIDSLETLDGHVAAIPNILAETYLNAKPRSEHPDLEQEREFQTLLFDEVIRHIGKKNIDKVHVLAESLGAFQSLQINREFHSLKMLSPPLHLDRSILRFDKLISKKTKVLEKCKLWWKWPYMIYKIKGDQLPLSISIEDKTCFGSWVIAGGFVMAIKKTAEKVKLKPSESNAPENFTQFVDLILPDFANFLKNQDERLSFNYLLKRVKTPLKNIIIISTKDDFLNELSEWDELKKNFPQLEKNIYLFPWGGHSGPIALNGFIPSLYK